MPITATFADLPAIEPGVILAWLGTYLLHSTLLLGAAWFASRLLRRRSLAALGLEEGLWKAALLGGLLTATLQTGLAALPAGSGAEALGPVATSTAAPAAPVAVGTAWSPAPAGTALFATPAPDPRLSTLSAVLPGWQRLALAGWLAGAVLLSMGLGLSWVHLRIRLRDRREVASGPARQLLDRLLTRVGGRLGGRLGDCGGRRSVRRSVRLTGTAALPVPVALGVGEREICLPRRALTELGERRQRGLLAHELAHLERRDPAWLLAARALESLLFFQPLNRLARTRLQEISELRCDAWAVEATGDRIGLARCLTEVAGWLTEERSPLPVPGMAVFPRRGRKNLSERVRRILESSQEWGERGLAGRRWLPAAGAAFLLGAVLLVPGLAPESFATPEPVAAAQDAEPARPATPPPGEGEPQATPEPEELSDPETETALDSIEEWDDDLDFDQDFDFDFDFDDLPDPGELSLLVSESMEAALAAQHEALEELDHELRALAEEGDLEPAARARLEADLRREVALEMERAHGEMERALREVHESMPGEAEMARLREELGRMNVHLREDMELELHRAREELERANRELHTEVRMEREEVRREAQRDLAEARREIEEARREMAREMEAAHRELEEARRELDARRHELEQHRRELAEQRRELERQRQELEERRREREPREEGEPQEPPRR